MSRPPLAQRGDTATSLLRRQENAAKLDNAPVSRSELRALNSRIDNIMAEHNTFKRNFHYLSLDAITYTFDRVSKHDEALRKHGLLLGGVNIDLTPTPSIRGSKIGPTEQLNGGERAEAPSSARVLDWDLDRQPCEGAQLAERNANQLRLLLAELEQRLFTVVEEVSERPAFNRTFVFQGADAAATRNGVIGSPSADVVLSPKTPKLPTPSRNHSGEKGGKEIASGVCVLSGSQQLEERLESHLSQCSYFQQQVTQLQMENDRRFNALLERCYEQEARIQQLEGAREKVDEHHGAPSAYPSEEANRLNEDVERHNQTQMENDRRFNALLERYNEQESRIQQLEAASEKADEHHGAPSAYPSEEASRLNEDVERHNQVQMENDRRFNALLERYHEQEARIQQLEAASEKVNEHHGAPSAYPSEEASRLNEDVERRVEDAVSTMNTLQMQNDPPHPKQPAIGVEPAGSVALHVARCRDRASQTETFPFGVQAECAASARLSKQPALHVACPVAVQVTPSRDRASQTETSRQAECAASTQLSKQLAVLAACPVAVQATQCRESASQAGTSTNPVMAQPEFTDSTVNTYRVEYDGDRQAHEVLASSEGGLLRAPRKLPWNVEPVHMPCSHPPPPWKPQHDVHCLCGKGRPGDPTNAPKASKRHASTRK